MKRRLNLILAAPLIGLVIAGVDWRAVGCAAIYAAENSESGSSPQVKRILDGIQRRYRDTQTYSASFNEEIAGVGSKKRERTGTMYLEKPGKMRWNFEKPDTETIVSDGTTLYNYDPDLEQVVETPLKRALTSSSAAAFLLGVGSLERDFDASLGSTTGGVTRITFVPKAGGNQIDLTVDSGTLDIVALTLKDQLGNSTAISFSDIKHNTPIANSMFSFKVPAGADIVTAPAAP
jgi:outer membrane lipoprotein carrier protein